MSDILQRIWQSVQAEFSDIRDVEQFTQMAVRLSMAAILGGIIGYEREAKRKSAGLRTHILVGLGSAMFVVIPLQAGVLITDLSRVLQGLVAGIGSLGGRCNYSWRQNESRTDYCREHLVDCSHWSKCWHG